MNIKKMIKPCIYGLVALILCGWLLYTYGRSIWSPIYYKLKGHKTVSEVITSIKDDVQIRLDDKFQEANLSNTPEKLMLIGLKEERILEIWGYYHNAWDYVASYPIKAASGTAGPKLKYGDKQVPEGIYKIIGLNPNSSYHLSMKINYPNTYDKNQASIEQRTNLGGNIFIHGKSASIGCLAMGDTAIEELFLLAYQVGVENTDLILAPYDFRTEALPTNYDKPWQGELYHVIQEALTPYQLQLN